MYVSADSSNSKRGESTQLRGFGGEGKGNKQGTKGEEWARMCGVLETLDGTDETNTDVLYYSKRRMKRTLERLHGTV